MGVRVFQPEMLLVLLMYFPFFFVFFFSNSLRVNGAMRFDGQPEWISRLVAGFANSAGLFLIIIIQYAVFAATGTVYWTTNWLSVIFSLGLCLLCSSAIFQPNIFSNDWKNLSWSDNNLFNIYNDTHYKYCYIFTN